VKIISDLNEVTAFEQELTHEGTQVGGDGSEVSTQAQRASNMELTVVFSLTHCDSIKIRCVMLQQTT
jgi:hypothetical protein